MTRRFFLASLLVLSAPLRAVAIARAKRGESRDAILDLYYRGAAVQLLSG